jgi:predicted Zn-dependent peptidase
MSAAWEQATGFKGVGRAKTGWGSQVGIDENGDLPEDDSIIKGSLPNGLRYTIKKNTMPQGRFFSFLEVHCGSIDEEEHQQGIAHFLEHMLFVSSNIPACMSERPMEKNWKKNIHALFFLQLGTESYPNPDAMREILAKLGMSQVHGMVFMYHQPTMLP